MKKNIQLFLILGLIFILSACSSSYEINPELEEETDLKEEEEVLEEPYYNIENGEVVINKNKFPKTIGIYNLNSLELDKKSMGESEIEVLVTSKFSNNNDVLNILFIKYADNYLDLEIKEEKYFVKIGDLYYIRGASTIVYLVENDFNLISIKNNPNIDISKFDSWIHENFEVNNDKISELNVIKEYSSFEEYFKEYKEELINKVEKESSLSSPITMERLESNGIIYVKNSRDSEIKVNSIKITPRGENSIVCENNLNSNLQNSAISTLTLTDCSLNSGLVYKVIVITDTEVFSSELIAR